jgi:hypothetical protein
MSPRVFHALVAALIRIGLLLALVILLMAENAQAQTIDSKPAGEVSAIAQIAGAHAVYSLRASVSTHGV